VAPSQDANQKTLIFYGSFELKKCIDFVSLEMKLLQLEKSLNAHFTAFRASFGLTDMRLVSLEIKLGIFVSGHGATI